MEKVENLLVSFDELKFPRHGCNDAHASMSFDDSLMVKNRFLLDYDVNYNHLFAMVLLWWWWAGLMTSNDGSKVIIGWLMAGHIMLDGDG